MALIKCPKCGKPVSDRAQKCPHCGLEVANHLAQSREPERPQEQLARAAKPAEGQAPEGNSSKTTEIVILSLFAVIIVVFAVLFFTRTSSDQTAEATDTACVIEETVPPAEPTTGEIAGHEWVDLGLPSGLKWATCNIGARNPEDEGYDFCWGETKSNGSYAPDIIGGTWLRSKGYIDSSNTLTMQHDAARVNWGSSWRMPTEKEIQELIDNTTITLTTRNGVKCMLVKSKRNDNSIIFPAKSENNSGRDDSYYGALLSSTFNGTNDSFSSPYLIYKNHNFELGYNYWWHCESGIHVRPVSGDANYAAKSESTDASMLSVSGSIAGHDYIDLGLPSGLKWATCNVGASKPEDYGDYFAWGETSSKNRFGENCASYSRDYEDACNGSYDDSYWLRSNGLTDGSGNITMHHDAARANWGATWRIPTVKEIKELIENTITTKTTINGVKGRLVTSTRNGKSIFFPAAGYRHGSSLEDKDKAGLYWSSEPGYDEMLDGPTAFHFGFDSTTGAFSTRYGYLRSDGLPVRPVSK